MPKKKEKKVIKKKIKEEIEEAIMEEGIVETPQEKNDNRKLGLIQELARLRKLHQDQVELGIHPDSKLEGLIANLDKEIGTL